MHLLALGLWFGSVAFFTFVVGPAVFASFADVVATAPSDRTARLDLAPGADAETKARLASSLASAAVGPVFPIFFKLQAICAAVAVITVLGRSGWRRGVVFAAALAVAVGWPVADRVAALRFERWTSTEANAAFVGWHLVSLFLSMATAALTAVALALAGRECGGIRWALHALALGLWFGTAAFFTFVIYPSVFTSFAEVVATAPNDRTAGLELASSIDAGAKAKLVNALGGAAVDPVFPISFGVQAACAVIAFLTALGMAGRRKWIVLAAALAVAPGPGVSRGIIDVQSWIAEASVGRRRLSRLPIRQPCLGNSDGRTDGRRTRLSGPRGVRTAGSP